jgi:hypothetical protein
MSLGVHLTVKHGGGSHHKQSCIDHPPNMPNDTAAAATRRDDG